MTAALLVLLAALQQTGPTLELQVAAVSARGTDAPELALAISRALVVTGATVVLRPRDGEPCARCVAVTAFEEGPRRYRIEARQQQRFARTQVDVAADTPLFERARAVAVEIRLLVSWSATPDRPAEPPVAEKPVAEKPSARPVPALATRPAEPPAPADRPTAPVTAPVAAPAAVADRPSRSSPNPWEPASSPTATVPDRPSPRPVGNDPWEPAARPAPAPAERAAAPASSPAPKPDAPAIAIEEPKKPEEPEEPKPAGLVPVPPPPLPVAAAAPAAAEESAARPEEPPPAEAAKAPAEAPAASAEARPADLPVAAATATPEVKAPRWPWIPTAVGAAAAVAAGTCAIAARSRYESLVSKTVTYADAAGARDSGKKLQTASLALTAVAVAAVAAGVVGFVVTRPAAVPSVAVGAAPLPSGGAAVALSGTLP